MFYLALIVHPLTKVSTDCPLKDFHHKVEERARQRGIPTTLRRLIADEGMLGLHF